MGVQLLALVSFRFPKSMLLFWTMLLVFFGFFAPKLESALGDHGLFPDGQYSKALHILSSEFHIPEDPVILLFEKKSSVSEAQFQSFIQQTMSRLQGVQGLTSARSPLERTDMRAGNFAYAMLAFAYKPHEMKPVLEEMEKLLPAAGDVSVKMTGKSVVQADVNRASRHDLAKAELIGLPIAFFILWLAFGRRIVTAMLPIVIGVTGVTITMGIMYGLAMKAEVSSFVLNVIPMVGLALSIDFALMLVSRFREELERSEPEQAIRTTIGTAGRAVLFSACSVFFGLLGIIWIPLPIFTTVAVGAMTVLIVSVLLSLTLLPALLSLLLPVIRADRKQRPAGGRTSVWLALSHVVMRRPLLLGFLAMLLLIVCCMPLSQMKLAIPDAASLPQSYEARQAAESFQAHFEAPSTSQVYLIAQGNSWFKTEEDWLNAYALVKKAEGDPGVLRVDSVFSQLRMSPEQLYAALQKPVLKKKYAALVQPFVKDNQMLIKVTLTGSPASKQVMDWLHAWEQKPDSAEMPVLLGGEAKYQQEVFDHIFENIKPVILFICVSNFIVLFAAFRSVLIAVKTIVMNLLSLGASFGILVWLFKWGHLGIEPASIAVMIPIFIFGLVFGISMDYGVFLVSRMYEIYRQTNDNDYAVRIGLASTGKIITSAAAIMIAVTAPFAFGEVVGVRQLGIGIAVAIFIDATVVRIILVPSLMNLFGRWNWWAPGRSHY